VNCREALEHFHDHVEGQLGPVQRWRLRLHLWLCGRCRKYLRSYKTTVDAEKAAFCDSADASPTAIPDDLVASILSAARIPPKTFDSNGTSTPPEP
jgi:anti-sigma factor RsiW